MELEVSPGKNQNLKSRPRTFLVRAMITLVTFAIGYSSIIFSQNLFLSPNIGKANLSVNIIQLDGPFAATVVRPSYPALVLNKETGQWEVVKPDAPNALTDGPPLPPSMPPPQILPDENK